MHSIHSREMQIPNYCVYEHSFLGGRSASISMPTSIGRRSLIHKPWFRILLSGPWGSIVPHPIDNSYHSLWAIHKLWVQSLITVGNIGSVVCIQPQVMSASRGQYQSHGLQSTTNYEPKYHNRWLVLRHRLWAQKWHGSSTTSGIYHRLWAQV